MTVSVASVQLRQDVKRTVEVVGTFQGLEEVMVTPKVSGRAVKMNYDVQDEVHTGDVLLEIDARIPRALAKGIGRCAPSLRDQKLGIVAPRAIAVRDRGGRDRGSTRPSSAR